MMKWLPTNVSTYGGEIDSIIFLIYVIIGFWFLFLHALIFLFLIRYRRRETRKAVFVHGNTLAQVSWILIPALVVLLLDFYIDFRGNHVWAFVKESFPKPDLHVRVTGKQFNWEILHPGPDGRLGSGDDLLLENELHVPVNQVIQVTLASKDVIHSFFLPHLRLKQDAMPGREIQVWFEVTDPGRYEIACAELCGFGHAGMKGWLHAHTPSEYENWVRERWPPPPA